MRIKLEENNRAALFTELKKGFRWDELATKLGVSSRHMRDWQNGKSSIPNEAFEKMLELSGLLKEPLQPTLLPDYWNAHDSARQGGFARVKLHGNPGTPEGRRRGGLASVLTHQKLNDGFSHLKSINQPDRSEKLAELLGIVMGDGHLSDYQLSITTNSETDIQHAHFIAEMIQKLFGVAAKLRQRKGERAVDIIASSKALVDYMHELGMPRGNKIENQIAMPDWIHERSDYQKPFLRGLFDTDGCVYLDHHTIKGVTYENLGWTITSYADTLRNDVFRTLQEMGFSPTCTAPKVSVFMRRRKDIVRYFAEIGTHNEKHRKRYEGGFA